MNKFIIVLALAFACVGLVAGKHHCSRNDDDEELELTPQRSPFHPPRGYRSPIGLFGDIELIEEMKLRGYGNCFLHGPQMRHPVTGGQGFDAEDFGGFELPPVRGRPLGSFDAVPGVNEQGGQGGGFRGKSVRGKRPFKMTPLRNGASELEGGQDNSGNSQSASPLASPLSFLGLAKGSKNLLAAGKQRFELGGENDDSNMPIEGVHKKLEFNSDKPFVRDHATTGGSATGGFKVGKFHVRGAHHQGENKNLAANNGQGSMEGAADFEGDVGSAFKVSRNDINALRNSGIILDN